ncbi:MAG: VWA domain-containing protein [Pyrinomonadaceae bacterium]
MQTERLRADAIYALRIFALLLLAAAGFPLAAQSTEPVETIRVDSDLVDLKVSVVSLGPQDTSLTLQQKDFQVFEDGAPQEISFFAAADAPFDLVLLLDLSGSTRDKINLVRRSAKRFVDATRPLDRVAIVTFTDTARVVSELTWDRGHLKQSIDEIEKPLGGTSFWDALRFVLQSVLTFRKVSQRTAVVVMTDGVDNALPDVFGDGSRTTFDELLSIVRRTDVLVFPVYIDTEQDERKRHRTSGFAYAIARDQLDQLAHACGTVTYRAGKLKDLDKVYERVIKDLGTVYSIGYKPTNVLRDGKWRSVTVKLQDRQDLAARTKSGYYAKNEAQSMKE